MGLTTLSENRGERARNSEEFRTEGGSARMEGAIDLAEEIFHVPVRLGLPQPQQVRGLAEVLQNPIYSTAVGLLLYARDNANGGSGGRSSGRAGSGPSGVGGVFERMQSWFKGNF